MSMVLLIACVYFSVNLFAFVSGIMTKKQLHLKHFWTIWILMMPNVSFWEKAISLMVYISICPICFVLETIWYIIGSLYEL